VLTAVLAAVLAAVLVIGGAAPLLSDAPIDAALDGGRGTVGSRPSQRGFRQMMTAIPQAVTRRSIAMKARSFCLADGPRGRTTSVGVLPRRGFNGRSGMRIVICATARAGAGAPG